MKNKVLLVSLLGLKSSIEPLFPLGLGYLVSSLKQDREVEAVHFQKDEYAYQQISELITRYNPGIIGLTCNSYNRGNVKKMCSYIKEQFPHVVLILGGVHVSFLTEQVLRNYNIDYIIIGEGENTIRELCNAIDINSGFDSVKGIAYLQNNDFIKNDSIIPINNLDSLPIPDFSFAAQLMKSSGMGFVISSRGCPVRCHFCSTGAYWGQNVRMNSPKRVVDEMEYLKNTYNVNKIFFHDDTFNLGVKRVIEICKLIIDRNLKLEWGVSCRVNPASQEMIDIMVLAGCRHICWGIETGSDEMMQKINKKITKEQIRNAFSFCEKHVNLLSTGAFMMVGNPGESEITINETVEFMSTIRMTDNPSTSILSILPGTKIYNDLLENDKSIEKLWIENDEVRLYMTSPDVSSWANKVSISAQIIPKQTEHFWNNVLFGNINNIGNPDYSYIK